MRLPRPISLFVATLGRVVRDESAQGLVEYAFILVLVAVVAIATLRIFGQRTNNTLAPALNGFS